MTPRFASEPPRPNSAAQVSLDEFEALPEDAQKVVREWAAEITALWEEHQISVARKLTQLIDQWCPSAEDKMSLWSQLPSHVRSALKKHHAPPPI